MLDTYTENDRTMATETLEDFYKKNQAEAPEDYGWHKAHINILQFGPGAVTSQIPRKPATFSRKDFYKIALVQGESLFHYADKSIKTSGSTLLFFSSRVPYTWEPLTDACTAISCVFNEAFLTDTLHASLRDLPMFMPGNKASYQLDEAQNADIARLFEKVQTERSSTYRLKYDLIRNYIVELFHIAQKMEPSESLHQHANANARITAVFIDLLERQFPIDAPQQQLSLRAPGQFADKLSVHVNHLNRAIKRTTGKTTSTLIAERVIIEAKALLKHTNWPISTISYSLGFDDMAHFDNFFRKQTATTPSAYRVAM